MEKSLGLMLVGNYTPTQHCLHNFTPQCCYSFQKCYKTFYDPIKPTLDDLWKKNASLNAYCKADIVSYLNNIKPYDIFSCKPSTSKYLTCTLPTQANAQDKFCNATRKLVAIEWFATISSFILFWLWLAVSIKICRSKEMKVRKKRLLLSIAIPA